MAEDGAGDCGRCCCSFILTSGLTALFLWLSLRTSKPSCSIHRFYLPPLNLSAAAGRTTNRTIDFDLKLQNTMKDKGVRYADISLAFSYLLNGSRLPVANYTVPAFYQGHGKKAHRKKLTNVSAAMPWEDAVRAVNGSTVTFRVDLLTRVKYKILFWNTKRQTLKVAGEVVVDGSGGMKKKKKKDEMVKLKSGEPDPRRNRVRVAYMAVFTSFVFLLL